MTADDHPQPGQESPDGQTPTPEMVGAVKSAALTLAVLALIEDADERRDLVGASVASLVAGGPELCLAVLANLVGRYGNALIGCHGSVEAARDAVLCELSIESDNG
jgi:hypothetical protein